MSEAPEVLIKRCIHQDKPQDICYFIDMICTYFVLCEECYRHVVKNRSFGNNTLKDIEFL